MYIYLRDTNVSMVTIECLILNDVNINLPKFRASGAVHLMGICFIPSETMYSSSSLDIPKSEILTMHSYPKEIKYTTLYLFHYYYVIRSTSNLVFSIPPLFKI